MLGSYQGPGYARAAARVELSELNGSSLSMCDQVAFAGVEDASASAGSCGGHGGAAMLCRSMIAAIVLMALCTAVRAQTYGPPGSAIPNGFAPQTGGAPAPVAPAISGSPDYREPANRLDTLSSPRMDSDRDWRVQRGTNDWRDDDWRARRERELRRAERERQGDWRVRQEDRSNVSAGKSGQGPNSAAPCAVGSPSGLQANCPPSSGSEQQVEEPQ